MLVHWPLMDGLLNLVGLQQGGSWAGPQPTQAPPRCTKCNGQCINNYVGLHIAVRCSAVLMCPLKG